MPKLLLTVLLTSIFYFHKVHGQLYNFKKYSLEEGMAQSQVLSICPDRRGDVWFGTYGGGACRFDGIDFEYFNAKNGLVNNSVWSVSQDAEGNIWFGTDEGISIYDGYRYYNYTDENGLPQNSINCIYHAKNGETYIGTIGGLIVAKMKSKDLVDEIDFNYLEKSGVLFESSVTIITEDNKGDFWIGTQSKGLVQYNNGIVNHYTKDDKLPHNTVNHILIDNNQHVWAATQSGIAIIADDKHSIIRSIANRSLVNVEHVFQDNRGEYWISSITNGLYKGKPTNFKQLTITNGLPLDNIRNAVQDASGCMWIGTDGGGAVKYRESPFTHYTIQQGLVNNLVMSVEVTKNGNIWFGTESGGVNVLTQNGISVFSHPQLANEKGRISSIHEDSKGGIWIGSASNKIYYVHNGGVKVYDETNGLQAGDINDFYEGKEGVMWVATYEGIWQIKNNTIIRVEPDVLVEQMWKIKDDSKGNLWIASDKGLIKYDGKEFKYFNSEQGLKDEFVFSVDFAKNGDVWVGTEEGIARFDGKKFTCYTIQEGLTSNNTYFSFFDNNNNYIVGTEQGFDKIKIVGTEVESIQHYGSKEGFIGIECNVNAFDIDAENNLWMGTIGGATKYNPAKENRNTKPPLLRLTGMQLFYENVNWDSITGASNPWNGIPENPVLEYRQNNLTFHYIGVNMPNPEKVTYQFKMEGFDENWSPIVKDRQVTYSNLPPGDYTFKLKAVNEDGVWTPKPIEYSFSIKAPFWRTTPFYIASIVALLLLFLAYNRWRTGKLRTDKLKLEEEVRKRTTELNRQKKQLEDLSIVAQEIQQGVIISDANGNIEWANPGFEKMSMYQVEEFKQKFGSNITDISSLKNPKEELEKMKQTGKGITYNVQHQNAEGKQMWASCHITPIQNEKGETTRFVSLYSDITKLKNAERDANQKNKDITDSIHYAKHIQEAILPDRKILYNAFPDSFILHKPKDIVSGDFYWFTDVGGVAIVCVADCTGHGVPGAFMSMIGNEFLHQVVKEKDITGPDQALSEMDLRIKRALSQSSEGKVLVKDGMDLALCAVHKSNLWMQFCGAHRPLLIVRNGEIIELKGQKNSIGGEKRKEKKFVQQALDLQKGDALYMFSDGYTDQFGGSKNKKFLIKRLKELLVNLEGTPMPEQREVLDQTLEKWKGNAPQVDDILMIGFKV